MNVIKMLFVMFVCLIGFGFAVDPFNNQSCGNITISGYYEINMSAISQSGANNITAYSDGSVCINISVSNVFLNLNGSIIERSGNSAAIWIQNGTAATKYLTNITIVNGTLRNSSYGIYAIYVQNSSFTNITLYNNTNGIYLYDNYKTNVTQSNFYNQYLGSSIWVYGGSNHTISGNRIYNFTTGYGMNMQQTGLNANHQILYNTIYNYSTGSGVYFNTAQGVTINNNNLSNSTGIGIYLASGYSNLSQFSGNILINVSTALKVNGMSNLTFSGNNIINQTPLGGFIANVSNGLVLSTNGYNITTQYLPFALTRATNVSIQVVDLNAASLTTISTIIGVPFTTAKMVQTLWSNYYGLNVTSEGATASISPTMYYSSSDLSPYSTSYFGIGALNSNGWNFIPSTSTSAISSLNTSTTLLGYFGLLAYVPDTTILPSSDQVSVKSISPKTSFDCKTGILTVTLSSDVDGGTVKLIDKTNFQDAVTAEVDAGKAVFTITMSGKYKIVEGSFSTGYDLDELTETYTLCTETEEEQPQVECTTNSDCSSTEQCTANECVAVTGTCGYATSHAWVSYECCVDSDCAEDEACTEHVCEESGGVPDFIDEITDQAAIEAINDATSAIETAKAEGKDTADAEAKLAEAQAAYDSGDPDLAESLARESIELIKEPQAEESEEDQTLDETTTEEPTEEKGTDYSMVLYIVGAVIVLFLLYKFVLKGGKGYRR